MHGSSHTTGLSNCTHSFSAATRNKGASYFRGGRVNLTGEEDFVIAAKVRGGAGRHYEVRIDVEQPHAAVYVACACPHFDDGNLCKHIWATMLAADQNGWLQNFAGRKRIEVLDDPELLDDLPDDDYFDRDDDDLRVPIARIGNRLTKLGGRAILRSSNKPGKDWYRALQALPDPHQKPKSVLEVGAQRERRILYFLDLSASTAERELVLELMQQEKRKDGQWGTAKPFPVNRDFLYTALSDDERRLLTDLLGNRVGARDYYGETIWSNSYYGGVRIEMAQSPVEMLPRLCATDRLFWVLSTQLIDDAKRISWDGSAWRLRICVEADDKKKQWTVRGEVYHGDVINPISELLLVTDSLVLFPDRLAPLESSSNSRWLSLLQASGPVTVKYADRKRLIESFWEGIAPEIVWPKNLQPQQLTTAPQGRLRVHKKEQAKWGYQRDNKLYADAEFLYGDAAVKLDDPRTGVVSEDGACVTLRDPSREFELAQELRNLGIRPNDTQNYMREPGNVQFPIKRLDEIVANLVRAGWQVEAEGALIRSAGKLSLSVNASGVDWFELESQVDFEGETATLPQLLAALRAGENYVKLGDGSRGMLPEKWLAQFAPLADLAEQHDGKLRFKPAQSLLLDALLTEKNAEMQVKVDEQFRKFRTKLQKFSGVKPTKAPRTFRGELRPYQESGVGWFKFLEEFNLGGCLADDMGLGKTVQVLAWLLTRRKTANKPTLIVVPKSLVFNWLEEARRFAPKLTALNYTGLDRSTRATDFANCDVVLTTYGTLRRDIDKLKDQRFDCVILDEAQAIKNDSSQTAKACRLLDADLRLALTGTPVENHLGELWSLFEFLNPGMLGRSAAFRTYCQQADEKPEVREHLRRGLAPFILRRTKQQVLKELPEKTEQTIHCELSPVERKKYNELRDYYRASLQKRIDASGMNKAKMHVLEALLRLRQAACHPGLLDKKLASKSSAKLDVLLEQIAEVTQEGHKALVFSQFTTLLSIVRGQLDKQRIVYEYLDGKTRNRQEKVDRFQTDAACPLFLISLKAGGCGLNLTAADYVFLLDPWWNPAVEAQAIDRTHRIGQTRNVFAYRLIAQDTVEEKILELQQQKRDLADAIISSNTNVLSKLTAEDLQVLLS